MRVEFDRAMLAQVLESLREMGPNRIYRDTTYVSYDQHQTLRMFTNYQMDFAEYQRVKELVTEDCLSGRLMVDCFAYLGAYTLTDTEGLGLPPNVSDIVRIELGHPDSDTLLIATRFMYAGPETEARVINLSMDPGYRNPHSIVNSWEASNQMVICALNNRRRRPNTNHRYCYVEIPRGTTNRHPTEDYKLEAGILRYNLEMMAPVAVQVSADLGIPVVITTEQEEEEYNLYGEAVLNNGVITNRIVAPTNINFIRPQAQPNEEELLPMPDKPPVTGRYRCRICGISKNATSMHNMELCTECNAHMSKKKLHIKHRWRFVSTVKPLSRKNNSRSREAS